MEMTSYGLARRLRRWSGWLADLQMENTVPGGLALAGQTRHCHGMERWDGC